ncbi:hypothetical protein TGS27_2136 [Geobacillus stearothermophilus]|uniref:Uncharacterized protein n=2 Tax=Geobacillus stearothermophilus TaxID=1422 RepID=A0ABQ7HGN9_GEOSE|nr:hypothetical protein GS8_951 [Geobacillus stearothermophilus]OAO79554.1 hypothetical protein TGS27_2136 [Geobacillus stearothermophilus]
MHLSAERETACVLSQRSLLPTVHVPLLAKQQQGWLTAEKQHARRKSEQQ